MPTHRYLLEAADSYRHDSEPENRLTEVLAEVLRTAPLLMEWLAAQAFQGRREDALAWTAEGDYIVETQFSFPTGERPDMKIRFTGPFQPPAGVLFLENKIDARFTDWQKRGYPSIPPDERVIVLTPDGRTPNHQVTRFVSIKWNELARAADGIGRTWSGGPWRELALVANAPSQYRMLAELIHYLEGEEVDVNVPGPLTESDLKIVPEVVATVDRWNTLFELVERELVGVGIDGPREPWDTDKMPPRSAPLTGWRLELRGDVRWPALDSLYSGWITREVLLAPAPTWRPASEPVPAFGVGVSIDTAGGWPIGLREGDPLRVAIEATNEFSLGTTWRGTVGRIFATLPLRDVATSDRTLDLQAERVAEWARERLDAIVRIDSLA